MTTQKSKPATTKSAKPAVSDGTITLTLTIPQVDIAKAYQQVLAQAAKSVELKGFRKGHAPQDLVEKSLDKSRLYSQVLELVLPPAYSSAIKKGKHLPLVEPRITPIKMEEGKDWEFRVETAGEPEIKVGDYPKYLKAALAKAKKPKDLKDGQERDWRLQIVFDAILKNAQVTPSQLLIEHEAHAAIHRLEKQLASLKLNLQDYLKSIKKSEKDFHQEYHQTAENNLRLEFALKAILQLEKPVVTDQELAKANPPQGQEQYVRYLLQKQKLLDRLVKL